MQAYLARHAQTLIGSFGRIVQQPFATLATMSVIGVAITLPLMLYLLLQNLRTATDGWNPGVDLSVYMETGAGASQMQAVANQLRRDPNVAAVRIITAAQGLAEFRKTSGFGPALDALENNPLPDVLIVSPVSSAGSPGSLDTLGARVAGLPGVHDVQLDSQWVKRLHGIVALLYRALVITGALIGIGISLVVGNTIRLDILNRHAEIEVMKLVGATDAFTRRPFLYSGFWYGAGGGMVAVILVTITVATLSGPVNRLAQLYGGNFHLGGLSLPQHAAVAAVSATLSWMGSWVVATHYIKGIEPT